MQVDSQPDGAGSEFGVDDNDNVDHYPLWLWILMEIAGTAYGLLGIFLLIGSLMLPMAFDDPSAQNAALLFVLLYLSFVAVLLCAAWLLWKGAVTGTANPGLCLWLRRILGATPSKITYGLCLIALPPLWLLLSFAILFAAGFGFTD